MTDQDGQAPSGPRGQASGSRAGDGRLAEAGEPRETRAASRKSGRYWPTASGGRRLIDYCRFIGRVAPPGHRQPSGGENILARESVIRETRSGPGGVGRTQPDADRAALGRAGLPLLVRRELV